MTPIPKTPTLAAEKWFQSSFLEADAARRGFWSEPNAGPANLHNLSAAVRSLAKGLEQLSIGLRAVYLKLEQLEAKVDKMSAPGNRIP